MQMKYVDFLMDGERDATGRLMFGWVEKDGDLGTGATSPGEKVYVGHAVDTGVLINLNPCFRWLVWRARTLLRLLLSGSPPPVIVG